MSSGQACILCELYGDSHPEHAQAPRHGDKDYASLKRRQIAGARSRQAYLRQTAYTNCENKVRYGTERRARRAAKVTGNPAVHAFQCRDCGGFHAGKGEKLGV